MKKKGLLIIGLLIMGFMLFSAFYLADLSTKEIRSDSQSAEKIALAKALLSTAIQKQGLDKINQFKTYEIVASDYWKGMMGKMGNPWGWNKDKMKMRFTVGDFDAQVEVLEGNSKGFLCGIQSWDYYEKSNGQINTEVADDKAKIFTTAAYHYFFELANRLNNAPVLRYAGKEEFKQQSMHKIYASWSNEKTKVHDQYLLWIGNESELIEAVTFTTRDNPMPAPKFMYGSLRFDDFRNVNGVLIPFKQTAQLMDPKEDLNDFIHQFNLTSFEWDSFEPEAIRPLKGLNTIGDDKPY